MALAGHGSEDFDEALREGCLGNIPDHREILAPARVDRQVREHGADRARRTPAALNAIRQ